MATVINRPDGTIARADMSKFREPEFRNTPITPDRYYSKEWADREWDKIWTKTWQIAGLAAQLKKQGDWLTADFGPETIVCVRGENDVVRAFYNVCQHRGMPVVSGARSVEAFAFATAAYLGVSLAISALAAWYQRAHPGGVR